ncbi:MAG: 50S ribosomal protein L14 [Sulfolobales archaeon]|nr:50S ribosomal protein L14 [Sulfolobales archaeon]MCX8186388.1 50S ribosomal protein L14 [Sulfolobales archaeon]MDW7968877.1 50S ribosomal protein L14 [Sulfolobales archaeon]
MGAKRAKLGAAFGRRGYSSGVSVGTRLRVADNSGAKEAMVVGIPGFNTRLRRVPGATVGDLVVVAVKKGTMELVGQVMRAVVIRQRKPYRRLDGTWIAFEDNACVIVTPEGTPKGSEVRGPVAREAAERWPTVANIATIIV